MTLDPGGTLRARFAPAAGGGGDVSERLGVGARRGDGGDEGLYLAEELAGADRWLGGGDSLLGLKPRAARFLHLRRLQMNNFHRHSFSANADRKSAV